MVRFSLLYVMLLVVFPLRLSGQDAVPVIPLLEAAQSGLSWRPDWPVSVPPDAFMPIQGPWQAVVFSGGEGEYCLARNREGLLTGFPFLWEGVFLQVLVHRNAEGRIRGFTVESGGQADASPAVSWLVEILEEHGAEPALARVTGGTAVYFAAFRFDERDAAETWYDADGTVLRIVSFNYIPHDGGRLLTDMRESGAGELVEAYNYDSQGNVSGVRSARGAFSVFYDGKSRPRYWARDSAASLSFQWDERGFLTTCSQTGPQETGEESRYEYALDEWGNWRERREVFMRLRFGYLVPAAGETVRRHIEYRNGDEG